MSGRRVPLRVIEGDAQPPRDEWRAHPHEGIAIAFVGAAIFWLGIGAAVLAWWERP